MRTVDKGVVHRVHWHLVSHHMMEKKLNDQLCLGAITAGLA